jgi:hypothetical protein
MKIEPHFEPSIESHLHYNACRLGVTVAAFHTPPTLFKVHVCFAQQHCPARFQNAAHIVMRSAQGPVF